MAKAKKSPAIAPATALLRQSVLLLREQYVSFMYLILLPGLIYLLGTLLIGKLAISQQDPSFTSRQLLGIGLLLFAAVWNLINIGPIALYQLRSVDGHNDRLRDLYRKGLRYSALFIPLYALIVLLVFGGLILVIIPGLIAIRRYILAPMYMIDQKLGVWQALKTSANNSKQHKDAIWALLGLQLVVAFTATLVQSLGSAWILVGTLLGYSTTFVVALRYRELQPRSPKATD